MVPGRLFDEAMSTGETAMSVVQSLKETVLGQMDNGSQHPEFVQSISQLDPNKNPLERTWRGNKKGTVRYQGYPDFKNDKYAERQWVKVCWGLVCQLSRFIDWILAGTPRGCISILGQNWLWGGLVRAHHRPRPGT